MADARKNRNLLADTHALDAGDARKWRDQPAQFWLERAITTGCERSRYTYDARYQAIGRISLPQVAKHQARMAALDDAQTSVPDLDALLMLRIGIAPGGMGETKASVGNGRQA